MNRLFAVLATMGATVLAWQVHAIDSNNQSTLSKREMIAQMADCMKKRISANKDSSYGTRSKPARINCTKATMPRSPALGGVRSSGEAIDAAIGPQRFSQPAAFLWRILSALRCAANRSRT